MLFESLFLFFIDNCFLNVLSKQMCLNVEQNRNNDYLKLMNQVNLIKGLVFFCDINYFELMNFFNLLMVILIVLVLLIL